MTSSHSSVLRSLVAVAALLTTSLAYALLPGSTPLNPGGTVSPGVIPSGTDPGTLLASLSAPFSTIDTSGTVLSAVFREASGTLDFYYQINNSQNSTGGISRETDSIFSGFITSVGYRTDGSTISGFVNGTVAPVSADRSSSGSVVGFSFAPPDSAKIMPGTSSNVLIISTNATQFTSGSVSVIDGGATTVSSFAPAIPEPSNLVLLGYGVLGLAVFRRARRWAIRSVPSRQPIEKLSRLPHTP